jgi:hypothetical protein
VASDGACTEYPGPSRIDNVNFSLIVEASKSCIPWYHTSLHLLHRSLFQLRSSDSSTNVCERSRQPSPNVLLGGSRISFPALSFIKQVHHFPRSLLFIYTQLLSTAYKSNQIHLANNEQGQGATVHEGASQPLDATLHPVYANYTSV